MEPTNPKYCKEFDGQPVNNQPGWNGIETGRYFIDFHGCWHEVKILPDKNEPGNNLVWMIGEYPS